MAILPLEQMFRAIAHARTSEITIYGDQTSDWPVGLLGALCKQGILRTAPDAESTICPGCAQACIMPVISHELASKRDPAYLIVCNKPEKFGFIEVETCALDQWYVTREGIESYLAQELKLRVKSREGGRNHIRYGISAQFGKLVSLEFTTTAELLIGDERIDLVDLLWWDGSALRIDQHLMQLLAATPTGTEPRQKSKLKMQRAHTAFRDQSLQSRAMQLKREQPRWTKSRIAKELNKERLFMNLSVERITRIIRTRTKIK